MVAMLATAAQATSRPTHKGRGGAGSAWAPSSCGTGAGARRCRRASMTTAETSPAAEGTAHALSAQLISAVVMLARSAEHTSELQSPSNLVWRLLLANNKP